MPEDSHPGKWSENAEVVPISDHAVKIHAPWRKKKSPSATPPEKAPRKKRGFWGRLWLGLQIAFIIVFFISVLLGYFLYEKALVYAERAQRYELKKLDEMSVTSTFYDVHGQEVGRTFVEDRVLLKADEIPDIVRQAVLSAEDRRFYQHGAIDYWGIMRAIKENLTHRASRQGGSTIEQQLAKNLIGDFNRNLDRKMVEVFLAYRIEAHLTKEQILNYYLNRIYFGQHYFGIGAAARGYFGKEARNLTVPECAFLAGLIRSPKPHVDIERATKRRDLTLKQMAAEGYISEQDEERYELEPVRILPSKPGGPTSFVMSAAISELAQDLNLEGTEEVPQGLTVQTNIDLRLQTAAEARLQTQLSLLEAENNKTSQEVPEKNPAKVKMNDPLQGAVLVAEIETGKVRAYVGGRDFAHGQFDHIALARRDNGVLLQPIIDAVALERLNLHPASMINATYLDPATTPTPDDLALGDPRKEVNKHFLCLQDALALGNKSVATRLGLQLGAGSFSDWLRSAGLEQAMVPADKPGVFAPAPMTLGEITRLYQLLGNQGVPHRLKIIASITSLNGEKVYDDARNDAEALPVLHPVTAQQMTLTLQNALRAGPARALARSGQIQAAVAGMPSISEGYRDAWFVGYTPELVTGVWIGYDKPRPIGSRDLAINAAVPFWGNLVQDEESQRPSQPTFPVPAELSKVEVNRRTGALCGLAGLAPSPGNIFVYLKKNQLNGTGNSSPTLPQPREWSDWLTTMFNQADETGTIEDTVLAQEKRDPDIPSIADYKLPGLRGDILASDGTVYATMGSQKNLVLGWPAVEMAGSDTEAVQWMRDRIEQIGQLLGLKLNFTDYELLAQYHYERYQPLLLLENLTPDQVTKLDGSGLMGKGFSYQTVPRRIYPQGTDLSHVLGHLITAQKHSHGKYLADQIIYDRYRGAVGLEQLFDQDLTGQDGRFTITTTADGYASYATIKSPPQTGNNVRLSIDPKIQSAVENALKLKKQGAAVIMDVHTGDVVAMASFPNYDPSDFVPAISGDAWKALNDDPFHPLLNRADGALYPPGSTFKTVTSIAAMTAGEFDPNWVVHCVGYFDVGATHILLPDEMGDVTYLEGFKLSYNTYFMTLGLKIGRDILLDTARSLGLGSVTKIDLPGELPGLIPDPAFMLRVHGRELGPGDVANISIGQGDVLVTPLQMANLMVAVADDGTLYRPRLVKQIEDKSGKVIKDFPVETLSHVNFDEKFMPKLKEAMISVIDEGTAQVVHRDDMKIAAKTGTAQVGSKLKHRQIAWLAGYLPADNPQYAFAIMIEGTFEDNHDNTLKGGLLGGRDAGIVAKHIFDQMYGKSGKDDADDTPNTDMDQSGPNTASPTENDATPATNAAPVNPAPPAPPIPTPTNAAPAAPHP